MNSDFKDLLAALCRHEVSFLLVGGYAVMFHSEPRFTKDIDLWIKPERSNATRLRDALVDFGAWLETMSIEDFCEERVMFQIGIAPTRVDLLTSLPGLEFDACWQRRITASLAGSSVPVIGLEDLITAKQIAGRDQDLLDLKKLRSL